jgi:hypothetical protein
MSDLKDIYKVLPYFIVGKKIGSGCYRTVHANNIDETTVFKFEQFGTHSNILEWETWEKHRWNPDIAKFLAPCVSISDCGRVLVQKKVAKARVEDLPEKIPEFITDLHIENWGWYNSSPVCIDYGILHGQSTELKKAEWIYD